MYKNILNRGTSKVGGVWTGVLIGILVGIGEIIIDLPSYTTLNNVLLQLIHLFGASLAIGLIFVASLLVQGVRHGVVSGCIARHTGRIWPEGILAACSAGMTEYIVTQLSTEILLVVAFAQVQSPVSTLSQIAFGSLIGLGYAILLSLLFGWLGAFLGVRAHKKVSARLQIQGQERSPLP